MNKVIILSLRGYRGASFGGSSTSVLAVGGNDAQSTIGYNYSNYVLASFDLNKDLPALEYIEIQQLTLKVTGSNATNPGSSGLTAQVAFNNSIENPINLNPNSSSNITLSPSKVVSGLNHILLSTELTLTKQYIIEMSLDIQYRVLDPDELPGDGGKIIHYPAIPTILSVVPDIHTNYVQNMVTITLQVDSRAIYHEVQIYQGASFVNSLLLKTDTFTGNTYQAQLSTLNIPAGKFVYFKFRSLNFNGFSAWCTYSTPLIKVTSPVLTITSISGTNSTKLADSKYLVMNRIEFNFTASALETITNVSFVLQHLYKGIWLDLTEGITPSSPSITSYKIPLDLNNEEVNGGLLSGGQRDYRICCKRGSQRDYSRPITLVHNKIPKIRMGSNNTSSRILSNSILKYAIIQEDENISNVESRLYVINGEELTQVATFLTPIVNITTPQIITLNLSSLKSQSWYIPGQTLRVKSRAIDSFGLSSELVECNTIYVINEVLNSPSVTPYEFYTSPPTNSKNYRGLTYNHIKWTLPEKSILIDDIVVCRIYRNGVLIEDNLFESDYIDKNLQPFGIGDSISYVVALWDGYEEVKSNPAIFAKSAAPTFKSNSISMKSITSITGKDYISLSSDLEHSSPSMVLISWPMATSDNSEVVDIQYILYIINHSTKTYKSIQLLNVVRDFVYNTASSLIALSDFGCAVGNEVELIISAVDRFGQESAQLQIVG